MDDPTTNPKRHIEPETGQRSVPLHWHCDTHGPGKHTAWGCPECVRELRRWKSTHAPRIEALEGLLRTAQLEVHGAREAIASLASERAANALLTDEVERLQAQLAQATLALRQAPNAA